MYRVDCEDVLSGKVSFQFDDNYAVKTAHLGSSQWQTELCNKMHTRKLGCCFFSRKYCQPPTWHFKGDMSCFYILLSHNEEVIQLGSI